MNAKYPNNRIMRFLLAGSCLVWTTAGLGMQGLKPNGPVPEPLQAPAWKVEVQIGRAQPGTLPCPEAARTRLQIPVQQPSIAAAARDARPRPSRARAGTQSRRSATLAARRGE